MVKGINSKYRNIISKTTSITFDFANEIPKERNCDCDQRKATFVEIFISNNVGESRKSVDNFLLLINYGQMKVGFSSVNRRSMTMRRCDIFISFSEAIIGFGK